MTSAFGRRYAACFDAYLHAVEKEQALHAAYELGREAVQGGSSVLELAMAHHVALRAALREAPAEVALDAAEEFFLESVAAFEMVQRGFREATDHAAVQRRHAEMLRQLSGFLADASLALHATDSLDEMLRLVCEQARDLASAACCMVTIGGDAQARFRAASYPEDDPGWRAFATWSDLSRVDQAVRAAPGAVRLSAGEAGGLLGSGDAPGGQRAGEWLAVVLSALDGRPLGAIHAVKDTAGRFSDLDEAVLSHLGHMASAAVERSLLYAPESGPQPPSGRRGP